MLAILAMLLYLLALACGLAGLVFFVMVVAQMFKRDESTMGIVCIVLTFCTGLGPIIAFIYGWTKAAEWDMKNIMKYWTIAFVLQIVLVVAAMGLAFGAAATTDPGDFNIDPEGMSFEIEGADFDMEGTDFGMEGGDFGAPAGEEAP